MNNLHRVVPLDPDMDWVVLGTGLCLGQRWALPSWSPQAGGDTDSSSVMARRSGLGWGRCRQSGFGEGPGPVGVQVEVGQGGGGCRGRHCPCSPSFTLSRLPFPGTDAPAVVNCLHILARSLDARYGAWWPPPPQTPVLLDLLKSRISDSRTGAPRLPS